MKQPKSVDGYFFYALSKPADLDDKEEKMAQNMLVRTCGSQPVRAYLVA